MKGKDPNRMARHDPTPEQQAVIGAYKAGGNLVIEAGAGTGKTSTLKMAAAAKNAKGLYVAFNRAIATEAAASFPPHIECRTAHSLAFRAVGRQFAHRLKGPRVPAQRVADILGVRGPTQIGDMYLAPAQIARLVMETVDRFCRSADPVPDSLHVPRKPGLDSEPQMREMRAILAPLARKAWEDLSHTDGRLRYTHDCYLKTWSLSGPRLPVDVVLLDEAQDSNGVVLSVVLNQAHAQLVAVGDRSQSLYQWRGAQDAMDKFPGAERYLLSQSFRFGSQVAHEANKWLSLLDTPLRLRGYDRISSMLRPLASPDAILCRTNAEAMRQAMAAMDAGQDTAIVGGGNDIRALAEAAVTLKAGLGTHHPELFAFRTWGEVQDHAENDPSGSDLAVFVRLIDQHGPDAIIAMCDRLTDEARAETVISTGHKAKGREWDSVKIAPDFREPKGDPERPDVLPEIPRETCMLAYVAVTRAKLTLDREGLAWVDKYLPTPAAA